MIEKKLAIRPNRPTMLTNVLMAFEPPYASSRVSTSGLSESWIASAPAAPGATTRISAANASSVSMAAMMPFGIERAGSLVSSAASGTPSTARKNQMAYGSAAQMPTSPNGRNELAPAASPTGMSVRLDASNFRAAATTNASSATTAIAVMANISLSASPTP